MGHTDRAPGAKPRHETHDIDVSLIAKLLGGGAILTAVILVAVFWLFGAVRDRQAATDPVASPYAANPAPFVGPKLQANPAADLKEIRAHEESILDSYGWVDRERGIVRIPIERAMDLLIERGLAAGPDVARPAEGEDAPR